MTNTMYVRYGAPGGARIRCFGTAPLDLDAVAAFDELLSTLFRLRNRHEDPEVGWAAADRIEPLFREVAVGLLGSDGLVDDVTAWLGDGPCEDGSLLEALAGLHDETVLHLGLAVRRQCTSAGFPPSRVSPFR